MRVLICSLCLLLSVAARAADSLLITLHGDPAPGALLRAEVVPGTQVWLGDTPLRVSPAGQVPFGFGRDAEGEATLLLKQGAREERVRLPLSPREWNIQRIEGVPQRTVDPPPPEVLARIREETALVRRARDTDSSLDFFADGFIWPLTGRISGVYGSQRVYNGVPGSPHLGLDIAAPTGTPVGAPAAGVVTLVHDDMFYSGGTLIIDHGYGVSTTFIHLSEMLVQEGDEVTQGQAVARVGATGRATGPHLDWRINWFQERLDPTTVVGPMPSH